MSADDRLDGFVTGVVGSGEVVDGPDARDDAVIGDWTMLVVACARINAAARRALADRHGLDLQSFEVLFQLSRCPGRRQTSGELAGEVSYSSGGFTKLADRLERSGFVARSADPHDRRLVWLELTRTGLDVVRRASADHAEFLRRSVVERLGAEQFALVTDAMRALLGVDAAI